MKRRFIRRRRHIRRRRFARVIRRVTSKYDGLYKAKIHTTAPLLVDSIPTAASIQIGWGNSGTTGTKDLYLDD